MNAFTFMPAVRDRVGLLIGLAGSTGSGKTLSALKIARGLAGGDDSRIGFIDTEGGRGKHYAPAPGETPGPNRFGFLHGDLSAPFAPEAYLAAIDAADRAGLEVIVIDSFSHVWDGDGGLQDMHGTIVDGMVARSREAAEEKKWKFEEIAARDKASIGAWKEPKGRYKRMVSRLLQCRAHLVICMRAEEKMRMETVEEQGNNGRTYKKTVITAVKDLPLTERWVPIVERRFPHELTTSFVLTAAAPGVPIPIKLQDQHRAAVPLDRPLSEETGQALAAWARGGAPVITTTGTVALPPQVKIGDFVQWTSGGIDQFKPLRKVIAIEDGHAFVEGHAGGIPIDEVTIGQPRERGEAIADRGMDELAKFWNSLLPAEKKAAGGQDQLNKWKARAEAAVALPKIGEAA